MLDHLDLLDEALATVRALEGPFSRVHADVVSQVGHDVGRVVTLSALELLRHVRATGREEVPQRCGRRASRVAVAGAQEAGSDGIASYRRRWSRRKARKKTKETSTSDT